MTSLFCKTWPSTFPNIISPCVRFNQIHIGIQQTQIIGSIVWLLAVGSMYQLSIWQIMHNSRSFQKASFLKISRWSAVQFIQILFEREVAEIFKILSPSFKYHTAFFGLKTENQLITFIGKKYRKYSVAGPWSNSISKKFISRFKIFEV